MERQIDLQAVSDGRLYGPNDMVKTDTRDCEGCSSCCHGMGTSIVLDPLDVHRLTQAAGCTFEQLLDQYLELNVVDGLILPNLKMQEATEACAFLNEQGRCRIHGVRPGICRLFPLGRLYENRSFRYFLQVHECSCRNRSKIKVKKWIGEQEYARYEAFVIDWHYFLKDLQELLREEGSETVRKQAAMLILNRFYVQGFDRESSFYSQFSQRLSGLKRELGMEEAE
ncbi:MAG: YkgJ family cysteine cluster protein [Lachnospiraceae bacterium]|nr:YkgJ family cysteine cluster protein [Lachnospiraceae bacterium]